MSPGISTRLLATQSDERLLRLVREGHERAFEALVNRYRRPLLNYCRRLSLPEGRAEDVLQQALMKTWIALRDGAEVQDIKAWLYRVVHNAAVNAARDAAYDRERVADPTLRLTAGQVDIERGLAVRETLAEVAALPPLQREVIVRTAVAGYSHEQVASDLGITDGAVRGLLYRARATLRTATTALTPAPLLSWLAGRADQGSAGSERLSELAGGGGTVGLGGLLVKGSVAAVTAGTLLTGAAVVHFQGAQHRHHPHPGNSTTAEVQPQTTTGETTTPTVAALSPTASARRSRTRPQRVANGGVRDVSHSTFADREGGQTGGATRGEGTLQRSGQTSPTLSGPVSSPRGSTQDVAETQVGTTQSGPTQSGSTQPTQTGAAGASGGSEPAGAAAGAGSGSPSAGSEGSTQTPTGSGSGESPPPSGSGTSESSGTDTGSGTTGGSSETSGSEQSGGVVKTVVHEVGSLLEHLLH